MSGNISDFQLGGFRVPKQIVNLCSSGISDWITTGGGHGASSQHLLSAALTANTFKVALQIIGSGELNFIALQALDATARSIRLRVTLDGVVVFDPPATAIAGTGFGLRAIGQSNKFGMSQSFPQEAYEVVPFAAEAKVEILSSLTETDKLGLLVAYKTY